jgi:phage terminase large subunit-like protein
MMLASSEITIQVSADVAEIYRQSSDAERQQLSMRIGALVRQGLNRHQGSYTPLKASMHRLAAEAQQNGLTPEVLESILNDE